MKSYRSRRQRYRLHLHKIINSVILLAIALCAICVPDTSCNDFFKNSFEQNYEENEYLQSHREQSPDYDNPETTDREFHDKTSLTEETGNQFKDADINLEDSHESDEIYSENSDYETKETSSDPVLEPTGHPHHLDHHVNDDFQTLKSRFNTEYSNKGTSEDNIYKSDVIQTNPESSPLSCLQVPDEIKNREKICQKGERGLRGEPGLSIEGEKGQKGEPCLFDYPSWAAKNKEIVDKENQSSAKSSKKPENIISEDPKRASYEIVPGSIVFRNRASLVHMTEFSRIGTIIFIKDEEKFFGRVMDGWREIMMGGDVIFLPVRDSKLLNDGSTTKPSKESDAVSRRRRTSRKNKKIKPHIRMAALNDPWNGDLHGVRGADHKCSREAEKAKINGTFRAFLSHDIILMKELVKSADRNLPVFNLQGQILFKSWNSIFENSGMLTKGPLIYSFNGSNVLSDSHWPLKRIWHGARLSESGMGKSSNCKSWNSDRFYSHGFASDLLLDGNLLLSQQKFDCRQSFIVLCIEIETISRRDKSE